MDADASALRVRAEGRAEVRYPLYRVSRVVANTRVDWSAAALQTCLESGIPIVFVSGDGAPLGTVHPVRSPACPLSGAIEELLDRPDWQEIYGNWLRSARMRVLAEWRAAREQTGGSLAPGEFKELARRFVYRGSDSAVYETGTHLWRAAVRALAAVALQRVGLQPVYWGAGSVPLNVLDDLAGVLELRLRLEVRAGMEESLAGDGVTLRVFHAMSYALDDQCAKTIVSLARRVKEALSRWR